MKLIIIVALILISCDSVISTDSVEGTITDAASGKAIQGINVTVEEIYSTKQYSGTTDADGYYKIKDIKKGAGLYLTAEKSGYLSIADSFDGGNLTKNYQMTKSN